MNIYCITSNQQIDSIKEELSRLGVVQIINAQKLSEQEVVIHAKDADILVAGPSGIAHVSADLLEQLPNLKLIATLTVNTNWIDLGAVKAKGVVVSNIKGANAESVAEHTWGMILDLAKRISEFDRDTRYKGAYKFNDYKGKEVYGKTLGIIGLGDIGKKVARIAQGFDMKVLGINRSGQRVDGVTSTDLHSLLNEADVITICVPLTEETKDMISDNEISLMKDGVILVNCSVEGIVNKDAVLRGLESSKLFGYGIETSIMTPVDPNDPYYSFSNVVLTPHNAFNTEDADKKSYELVLENIKAFINGTPQNVVTE